MPRSSLLLAVGVVASLYSTEAHVSGGYGECFADVDHVVCVESQVRKRFLDDAQAKAWMADHRDAAEGLLSTAVPRLREALRQGKKRGLPIATVHDWRLMADDRAGNDASSGQSIQHLRLDMGPFSDDVVAITVTVTRALGEEETGTLRALLMSALKARDGSDKTSSAPSTAMSARPQREDMRQWQPLWVSDRRLPDAVDLGIGTIQRVSPQAAALWRPWLGLQLRSLRAAWEANSATCALPAPRGTMTTSAFADLDGFRAWGPLVLEADVQARHQVGAMAIMARLVLSAPEPEHDSYGTLSRCLDGVSSAVVAAPPPALPAVTR